MENDAMLPSLHMEFTSSKTFTSNYNCQHILTTKKFSYKSKMKKIKKQNGNYIFIFYNVPRRTKLVGTIDRFYNVSTEGILVMKMIEYFG